VSVNVINNTKQRVFDSLKREEIKNESSELRKVIQFDLILLMKLEKLNKDFKLKEVFVIQ
jgi:hypothetical protein